MLMTPKLREELAKLNLEEKMLLVDQIWDDIAREAEARGIDLSTEMGAEWNQRYRLFTEGRTSLYSREDMEKSLKAGDSRS